MLASRPVGVEELRRDNERLAALAAAEAHIGELTTQVGRLADAVAQGNERIAESLAIAQCKKRRGNKSAAKPPSPPPTLDEDARKVFDDRPAAPEPPDRDKPAKQPRRPTGRKPVPEQLQAEDHSLRPDV